jgi:hypothetical protein
LNIGPSFRISSILYHAVIEPLRASTEIEYLPNRIVIKRRPNAKALARPRLSNKISKITYRNQEEADLHPVHAVIPDLIIGATNGLSSLNQEAKARYLSQLEDLAAECMPDGTTVRVDQGAGLPGQRFKLPDELDLKQLRASARKVGALIATIKLRSLKGRSLEEIETWDDQDETAAQGVATRLANGDPLPSNEFDDAQILAGALVAILRQPEKYDAVSESLRHAFDDSYKTDPLVRPS